MLSYQTNQWLSMLQVQKTHNYCHVKVKGIVLHFAKLIFSIKQNYLHIQNYAGA